MSMPEMNLVVIRASDVDQSVEFYRNIGLDFTQEQHGKGPVHYAAELGRLVFEIYPVGKSAVTSGMRLGFTVVELDQVVLRMNDDAVITSPQETDCGYRALVQDPDTNKVELIEQNSLR